MATPRLWAAIQTVKSRVGTWRGFEQYRQLDPEVTRTEWARAVGEARAAIANKSSELTAPLNRRPLASDALPFSTRGASGFIQQVEVYVRDRDTGLTETRHHSFKTDTLRSRQSVVDEVRRRFQASVDTDPSNYPEDILGVGYTGTYVMTPR